MINGWLLYDRLAATHNESYIAWFITEAKKQNINLKLIFRECLSIGIMDGQSVIYVNDIKTTPPHFVIVRTIESILQAHFESVGIPTFNNVHTAKICNHKSWTHMELNKLNIPMVATFFARKSTVPNNCPLPFPVVIKEATGRGGKQVQLINNEAEWTRGIKALTTDEFIIQETNVQYGKDVRVFVIGKEIICAVLRKNENDFRANFTLGGKAISFHLTEHEKKMVQKIIDHFDFGLVGIDFLINEHNELVFNEIEDVVGSRIVSEVSEINLLEKYVSFIKEKVLENE